MENNKNKYLNYIHYILHLDLFGIKYQPKLLGIKKQKSYLSTSLSIIFFYIIISNFIVQIFDFLNHKNYQVYKSIKIDKTSSRTFDNFSLTLCPYYISDNEAYDFSGIIKESETTKNDMVDIGINIRKNKAEQKNNIYDYCSFYNLSEVKFKYDIESNKGNYVIDFSVNTTLVKNIPALNIIFNQHYINEKNYDNPIFPSQKSILVPLIKDKDYHIYFQEIKIIKIKNGKFIVNNFSNNKNEKSIPFFNNYIIVDKNYFSKLNNGMNFYRIYLHFTGEINEYFFTTNSIEQFFNHFGGFCFFWYYIFKIICKRINTYYLHTNKKKQLNNLNNDNKKKLENYISNKILDFDSRKDVRNNIYTINNSDSDYFKSIENRSPNISPLQLYKSSGSSDSSIKGDLKLFKRYSQGTYLEKEKNLRVEIPRKKRKSYFANEQMVRFLGVPCSPTYNVSPLPLKKNDKFKSSSISNSINNFADQDENIIKNEVPISLSPIDNVKRNIIVAANKIKNDTSDVPLNEGGNINLINVYNRNNLKKIDLNKVTKNKEENQNPSVKNKENIQSKIKVNSSKKKIKILNEENEFNKTMDWINIYSAIKELKLLELLLLDEDNCQIFFSAKSKVINIEKLSNEMESRTNKKTLFSDMNEKIYLLNEISSK